MQAVGPDIAIELANALLEGRARLRHAERLGAGKFSDTFLVSDPGGGDVRSDGDGGGNGERAGEFVLRIAPADSLRQLFYEYRMMRQEPDLHALIQRRTTIPIPTILAHDFSRERLDRDYLLMNRLPGVPLSECAGRLTRAQRDAILRRLGEDVARLHGVHGERYGYVGPHRPMEPQATWHDAFAIMWARLLDDCVACGVYDDADRTAAMRLWDRDHERFAIDVPPCVCHMDLWAANVLVDDGRYSALFDFDRACYGDPGNELAVAEYCGLTGGPFWEGYGRRPDASEDVAVRRWFYLMYEHQKYIVIRMSQRHSDPPSARRYADECRASMAAFARSGVPQF